MKRIGVVCGGQDSIVDVGCDENRMENWTKMDEEREGTVPQCECTVLVQASAPPFSHSTVSCMLAAFLNLDLQFNVLPLATSFVY